MRTWSRPLRAVVLSLLVLVVAASAHLVSAPAASASLASDELSFLDLLNSTRRANGRAPLAMNSALSSDARGWSKTMAGADRLWHTPNAQMIAEVSRVVPSWAGIGENVGYAWSVRQLHDALWASPPHRANMLGDYTHVGIGTAYRGTKLFVTFRFVKGAPVTGSNTFGGGVAGFPDVSPSAYYASAVRWLVAKKITTGVGDTGLFMPDAVVTRAQMVTFLHRLAGSPSRSAPRFADVPSGAYYAKAVAWARATGLTTGVGGANVFRPNDVVTREQMAAFLFRFAGSPAGSSRHGFSDVRPGSWAEPSIAWLVRHSITTGTGPGRYSPTAPVTRGQTAAFLHRLASTPSAFDADGIRIP